MVSTGGCRSSEGPASPICACWSTPPAPATTTHPLLPLTCSLTKLRLVNPSRTRHFFTIAGFADNVYTVLVLMGDPEVEVKGKVQVRV